MKLPNLPYGDQRMKQAMLAFGGVDYTPGAQSGQWEDTENVSCREYPALVPRESREIAETHDGATALYVYDKIAEVIGTGFYYDGVYKCPVSPGRKQIVTLGDQIIIYPDKVYYDTENDTASEQELTLTIPYSDGVTVGTLSQPKRITLPTTGYHYTSTGEAGTTVTGRGQVTNVNPTVKMLVYAPGGEPTYVDKHFDEAAPGCTIQIEDTDYTVRTIEKETRFYWAALTRKYIILHFGLYVNNVYVEHGTIGGWAYAADTTPYTADINKVTVYGHDGTFRPSSVQKYLNQLEIGDMLAYDADAHTYEVVEYIDRFLYTDHYYYTAIRTKVWQGEQVIYPEENYTTVPDWLEHYGITAQDHLKLTAGDTVIETQISSFGERYIEFADDIRALGNRDITIQRDASTIPDLEYICTHNNRLWGVAGDKIYASAWGYPAVFGDETVTQADPWSTRVAEDGEWTGIISYSGALLAFKEHVMYKIVGTMPENYTVYTYHVEGIKKGCHKSAVIIGEVLYYMGPGGVYAYSGSVPQLISENFGTRVYSDAVAGTEGRKYYISAKRPDGDLDVWDLHVLDTEKGIWLREDHLEVYDFARYKSKLYALDSQGRMLVFGSGNETVNWYAVTAKLYEDIRTQYINIPIEHHSYSRFVIRVELDAGSTFNVEVSYDGEAFTLCYKQLASRGQVYNVPIVPRRCDNMRIRLSGTGYFRLLGIVRAVHGGSSL